MRCSEKKKSWFIFDSFLCGAIEEEPALAALRFLFLESKCGRTMFV